MDEDFTNLIDVVETLLGPQGCPWDQKQTFVSLQPYLLEEAHEVIEAVDCDDTAKMVEELGDLLFNIIFYAKLGEKTQRFSLKEVIASIRDKLVRRHPHVFGDAVVKDDKEVLKNWEKIKAGEKGKKEQAAHEGMPPTLPVLVKAQKVVERLLRKDPAHFPTSEPPFESEEEAVKASVRLLANACRSGVDLESALRRHLHRLAHS